MYSAVLILLIISRKTTFLEVRKSWCVYSRLRNMYYLQPSNFHENTPLERNHTPCIGHRGVPHRQN